MKSISFAIDGNNYTGLVISEEKDEWGWDTLYVVLLPDQTEMIFWASSATNIKTEQYS